MIISIGIVFVFLLSLASPVSADLGDGDFAGCGVGMQNMMYGYYGYGPMIFGWMVGILFIAALVLLIVWLVRQIEKPKRRRR